MFVVLPASGLSDSRNLRSTAFDSRAAGLASNIHSGDVWLGSCQILVDLAQLTVILRHVPSSHA